METAIDAVRAFNRFFTRHVGAMDARFLGTDTNLAEARLLFEIARREPVAAASLQTILGIDRGYMSRMVARFEARGWIVRKAAARDDRSRPITLTKTGRTLAEDIDQRQRATVSQSVGSLSEMEQNDLVRSLTMARLLLDPTAEDGFTLRTARVGEVSLVASRQSIL